MTRLFRVPCGEYPSLGLVILCVAAAPAGAAYINIRAAASGSVVHNYFVNDYHKYSGDMWYDYFWSHGSPCEIEHAFVKLRLDSMPSRYALLSADLNYFQQSHWMQLPHVRLRLIPDPDNLAAEPLYNAILGGYSLAPADSTWDGWVTWSFGSSALSILDSCLRAGLMSCAVQRLESGAGGGVAFGCDSTDAPYLRIVYVDASEAEIQALHAELLTYPVVAQGSDTALLTLTNKGLHASAPFWAYVTAPGLALESTLVSNIAAGETISVAMPLPSPNKADTFVTYRLWSVCPNDPWPGNDTTPLRCWPFPASTYAAEGFDKSGFPPPGWVIVNSDGGSQCWQWRADDGMNHSGGGFTMCVHEQDRENDDWLISGPIYPKTGEPDSLGFYYRAYQTTPTLNLQVWAMRGQTVADRISDLAPVSVSDTTYRRRSLPLDRFDGDTIYVGFRFLSQGEWNGLCLDDIWFCRVPIPGTCEPQTSLVGRSELGLAPNPATGRFIMARYDITAGTYGNLKLRDVLGRVVKTFTLDPSGITHLDLRSLAPGVYMATLQAGTQSLTRKFVITTR